MAGVTARLSLAAASALVVAGCASTGGDTTATALSLPQLPSLPSVAAIGAGTAERPVGSATEVYARVALGANTCWFGANGPLKKAYIYHAEADAPSRGGKAEIVIHAREPALPNPRGAKAYRIKIEPAGDTAALETENLKMPDAEAAAMTSDVGRWSKGDQGCAGASTAMAAGWMPQAPAAAAPVKKANAPAKKSKTKTAAAAKPVAAAKPSPPAQ